MPPPNQNCNRLLRYRVKVCRVAGHTVSGSRILDETNGNGLVEAARPKGGWSRWRAEPGTVYTGLPEDTYHGYHAASKSGLDKLVKSPAHYRWAIDNPTPPTHFMTIGSAIDCLIFTPADFDQRFIVEGPEWAPRSKNYRATNDYKDWKKKVAGTREVLRAGELESVQRMRDAIHTHPLARVLLEDSIPQPSAFWIDDTTGEPCKARADAYNPAHRMLVDLKKVQDAAPHSFARSATDRRYHVQAAYYLHGFRQCGLDAANFLFLVIEEAPPHGVNVVEIAPDSEEMARGEELWQRDLLRYHECIQSGEWPSYPVHVHQLAMSRWQLERG